MPARPGRLRLRHCPSCGYDLTALPRRHHCPECGFEYDEAMFSVDVWRYGQQPRLALAILNGLVTVAALLLLGNVMTSGRVPFTMVAFWGLLGAASLISVVTAMRQYALKRQGRSDTLLVAAAGGLAVVTRRRTREERPWTAFRRVEIRRLAGGRWRLIIRWGGWHWTWKSPLDLTFDLTKREAALVRNELRRRIANAS